VAPSPIVGCVAVIEDYTLCRSQRFKDDGDLILMIGSRSAEMAGSLYLDAGFQAGRPAVPPLDFDAARCEIRGVIDLVKAGLPTAVHDISDGGVAVCLSEMAMGLEAGSARGARVVIPEGQQHLSVREFLFSEAGGFCVTLAPRHLEQVADILDSVGADWWPLGVVQDTGTIAVCDTAGAELFKLDVAEMTAAWQTALPRLLVGDQAAAAVPPLATGKENGQQQDPARVGAAINLGAGPRIAVVQLPGVNCEEESRRILAASGAEAEIFRWTRSPAELAAFDGFLLPGGFSYQDRVRAGAVAAKDPLLRVLLEAAGAGKPILGICNGCQVLVEAGLVPGLEPGAVEVALAANRFPGRRGYHSRWVGLEAVPQARTPFVEGLTGTFPLPIAHAEGRFTHADPEFFTRLESDGLLALRYTALGGRAAGRAGNPNGSLSQAAGLTNTGGNVLAMMPHPERAAQLRHVPEDLPHAWGRARQAAAGDFNLLEAAGPGSFLMRRLVELC
jgi:phosphoribosylformylglycinamidine synthase